MFSSIALVALSLPSFSLPSPLFADSTANQAIIFSPPFSPPPSIPPIYPNYSLPSPSSPFDNSPPANPPNYTLLLSPTEHSPRSASHLASRQSVGTITNQSLWLRDNNGWRFQWLVSGLSPSTNYTAYVIQDTATVTDPIYFTTKSPTFSCPLVFSLPYCPTVAYPVPLPLPSPLPFYDATTLPASVSAPILEYIANFTATLLTFPCGRDVYSPLTSCADCQHAYRTWLCTIAFTRCSEQPPTSSTDSPPQSPLPALVSQPPAASSRNSNILPPLLTSYTALLPCLETCTAVDRACPNFLGFRCPRAKFNAANSYAVGYIDSRDGEQSGGIAGVSQDAWGNIWCNGDHLGLMDT